MGPRTKPVRFTDYRVDLRDSVEWVDGDLGDLQDWAVANGYLLQPGRYAAVSGNVLCWGGTNTKCGEYQEWDPRVNEMAQRISAAEPVVNTIVAATGVAATAPFAAGAGIIGGGAESLGLEGFAGRTVSFAQRGVSSVFRNGPFKGKTIQYVANLLRTGAINASDLPLNVVVRNGVTYTMNNRSLLALVQAGLGAWPVVKYVTGDPMFEAQLTTRLLEMGGAVSSGFIPFIR
jgi:hypothetical protein